MVMDATSTSVTQIGAVAHMTKAPTLAVLNKTGSSTLNAVDATVSTEETETSKLKSLFHPISLVARFFILFHALPLKPIFTC